jgi:ClpP class serine protease
MVLTSWSSVTAARNQGGTMARSTTFEQIRDETSFGQNTRTPLLAKLQEAIGRRVVSFFTSFSHRAGMISNDDADMLTELLRAQSQPKAVSLIISSPGGYALGAERIVHACREASGGDFEVIVPGQAKFGCHDCVLRGRQDLDDANR